MEEIKKIPLVYCFFLIILLSFIYVYFENNIYYWDYSAYYSKSVYLNIFYHRHPFKAIGNIFSSVWKSDYNYIPAIIPSFFIMLSHNHRQIYIQSIIMAYYIPFCIIFVYLSLKIFNIPRARGVLIPLTLVITNCSTIGVVLRGFPDIGGMIFIEYAIVLACSIDYSQNVNVKKALLLGLCLWGAFLFRRWYAYTVATLYISMPFFNYYYFNSKIVYNKSINVFKNFLISGILSTFMALLFQFKLLNRIIKTNYSVVYSAWQDELFQSIIKLFNEFGYYLIPFFILGIIVSIYEQNRKIKVYIFFCMFNLIFSVFLFLKTQSPGMQHVIPFSFWMITITAYGLSTLFHSFQRGRALQISLCIFFYMELVVSLFCNQPYQVSVLRYILPMQLAPLHVESYQVYKNLVDDLEHDYKPSGTLAILSSSPILNASMIESISDYRLQIGDIAHVDLRDAGNWFALNAKYVVVVSPIQTHLPVTYQRMVALPAYEILNHVGIGENYKRIGKSYELKSGVYAYVYEKIKPFSQSAIADFNQKIYHYYPDWEKKHLGYIESGM